MLNLTIIAQKVAEIGNSINDTQLRRTCVYILCSILHICIHLHIAYELIEFLYIYHVHLYICMYMLHVALICELSYSMYTCDVYLIAWHI